MCICCCFCNCCNSYSSKCIELCIFVLSSISFASSILGLISIKWPHLTNACIALQIIIIAFSTFLEVSSLLIITFRHKGTINNSRNTFSTYIALTCFILSIIIFIISLVVEGLVQANFNDIDYPCKDLSIKNDPNVILFRGLSLDILSKEEKKQFCQSKNSDYNAQILSKLEYTMSYLTSSIIEVCSLLLIFFFYNDYRRLRGKYDGELPIHDNPYLNRELYARGINFQDNGEQNEPSERNINQKNIGQSKVVLVDNKSNNLGRKSQQIILKDNKENSQNNFIRSLRMEIKEALESLEEESGANENEKNEDKFNSEKNSENNSDKNNANKNNNFMEEENKI